MSHPFDNQTYRHGSAKFVREEELERAGLFLRTPTALYLGEINNRPIWYDGDGGALIVAGARTGKLRDILAYWICSGMCEALTLLILDVKGELAAISQNQTPDGKYCLNWNPHGLHDLPRHRINPFGHLKWSSPTLFSDVKVAMQTLLPQLGGGNSRYFELNARRIAEALALTIIKVKCVLTFPDLYDALLRLIEGGERWKHFAYEMYCSGIPECRSVETEIHDARSDSSGGYKGIIGELQAALSCLSDPVLRDSVSAPFDADLSELTSGSRFWQFYMMCPPDMIEGWSPVIKSIFAAVKTLKTRAPNAPRQTWLLDEAARLYGFEDVPALFTDGAGIGIRPVAVFQDAAQMNDLAPNAERKISSSAAVQVFFGTRDLTSGTRVSNMIGDETLFYRDALTVSRAEHAFQQAVTSVLGGEDPFKAAFAFDQKRYEIDHENVQRRKLRNPDEVMRMRGDRMFLFIDGLSGPVYAERKAYWTRAFMAGRYHPNPYHPPTDRVRVQTRWGQRWRPVIVEPVPDEFADYPQYRSGLWSRIGE